MDQQFIRDRITAAKAHIVAIETALETASGGVVSYSINTGQTQTSVTRASLADVNKTLDGLYNRIATLEARLTGGGVTRVIPTW